MRSSTIVVGLVAALAGVAAYQLVSFKSREGSTADTRVAEVAASSPAAEHGAHDDASHVDSHSAPSLDAARVRHDELSGASPTFRNTSFLIAIRDAGYVCADIIEAVQSGDELAGWRVVCRDARAYAVAVDGSGDLVVDAVPQGDILLRAPLRDPTDTILDRQ